MAVKRGPDGVPVDVPTVMGDAGNLAPKKKSSLFAGSEDATIPPPNKADYGGSEDATMPPPNKAGFGNSEDATMPPNKAGAKGSSSLFPDEPATVPAYQAGGSNSQGAQSLDNDDPPTVIAGGCVSTADPDIPTGSSAPVDPMADPVVGWLVIIDGPGKGSHLRLGNGQNSIGRGAGERVQLDFGDDRISRNNHAVLTFDPRGMTFFIQQGTGTNLAYVNNSPVLAPTALEAMNEILLGETTLLFVPLCGKDFSWS